MRDKYPNFAALAFAESADAFSISLRNTGSSIVVAAPHGGGIEPGTSEIALSIAGNDLSYYLFEGKKVRGNDDLHVTSSNFDEPQCLVLLKESNMVLTVHGEDSETEVVFLGGLCSAVLASIRAELELHGFTVRELSGSNLQGHHPQNICNIGRIGAGIQLELSSGLRRSFFKSLTRTGRKISTPRLLQFTNLIRYVLLQNSI